MPFHTFTHTPGPSCATLGTLTACPLPSVAAQSPLSSLGLIHLLSGLQWSVAIPLISACSFFLEPEALRVTQNGAEHFALACSVSCLGKGTWTRICKQSALLFLHLTEGPSHTLLPLDRALYDCTGVNNSIFGNPMSKRVP